MIERMIPGKNERERERVRGLKEMVYRNELVRLHDTKGFENTDSKQPLKWKLLIDDKCGQVSKNLTMTVTEPD